MKLLRTPVIVASLIVGLSVGLSGFAMAQTTAPSPAQPSAQPMAKMHAAMQARHIQRLADLKSKLKLDAGQESAWLDFTQSMQMPKPPASHSNRVAMENLTTPERLDLMQAHKAQRDAQMLKRMEATKSFYAALNPDQKKVFDSETSRFMKSMGDHLHNAKHGGHRPEHHTEHHTGNHSGQQ